VSEDEMPEVEVTPFARDAAELRQAWARFSEALAKPVETPLQRFALAIAARMGREPA